MQRNQFRVCLVRWLMDAESRDILKCVDCMLLMREYEWPLYVFLGLATQPVHYYSDHDGIVSWLDQRGAVSTGGPPKVGYSQ